MTPVMRLRRPPPWRLLLPSAVLWVGGLSAVADEAAFNAQLIARNRASIAEMDRAYRELTDQVNQRFDLDYRALDRLFRDRYREYHGKLSIIEGIQDPQRRDQEYRALQAPFRSPEAQRYLEARLFLEHEFNRNHLLKASRLQVCEEILEALMTRDPLLRYFFRSAEYQERHGLLLTHVAWGLPEGTAALTRPLDAYTMFADRTRMPVLITVSPKAFDSLAYLRSVMVHELNHVLLEKEPIAAELGRMSTAAGHLPLQPSPARYARYFTRRYGRSAAQQYHLMHEYYAFAAQSLYDDQAQRSAEERLSAEDRRYIETLRQWVYDQLSPQHRAFLQRHPDPPIAAYLSLEAQASAPPRPAEPTP